MNFPAIAFSALALAAATAAAAAPPASDLDYIKASRCRGIAAGVGAETSALDAYLKAEGGARPPAVESRADDERARARRQAGGEGRARLEAELSGPCAAYMGAPTTMASRRAPAGLPAGL